MKRVPLTHGLFALVDSRDFERMSRHKWRAHWNKAAKSFYAVRRSNALKGKSETIYMHRAVTCATSEAQVDHKNHDGLDNRRSNLRLCVSSENCRNRRLGATNTSGFKGVSWKSQCRKWRAQITVNRRTSHIGYFPTSISAARAYDVAAERIHGDFALTNKKLGLYARGKK